ncbi:MAG: DUF4124 domain-containing protein [Betaproteobacteria bacterium]|nr:MAG: DUF4124 domain-containing protein [Betaproteobacteria bacterium]TMI00914.1 MAG: DUF4124 domain-containing protein [Betaproteobacteria bacterium]TMI12516.1 MAG: DUF4124 domain-containing protein [Betaproteobacteria bacterium]
MSRGLAGGRAGAAVISPKLLAVVLLLVARPLCAETYKWVDEKGVTNYSSSPPANAKLAEKTQVVEERLSVYTPDPGLLRAIQVRPPMSAPMPYSTAVTYAPQHDAAATQPMYDDYPYAGYFPYIVVFAAPRHVRRTPSSSGFHVRTASMASSFPVHSARMGRASWSR